MHFSECIENGYASEPCERMPVRIGASGLQLGGEQGGWLTGWLHDDASLAAAVCAALKPF